MLCRHPSDSRLVVPDPGDTACIMFWGSWMFCFSEPSLAAAFWPGSFLFLQPHEYTIVYLFTNWWTSVPFGTYFQDLGHLQHCFRFLLLLNTIWRSPGTVGCLWALFEQAPKPGPMYDFLRYTARFVSFYFKYSINLHIILTKGSG